MNAKELIEKINSSRAADIFAELYGTSEIETARRRYTALVEAMPRDASGLRVFSAPGRTELAGNHTDHNGGKVLAASIQLDSAAIVQERQDDTVFFQSSGYPDVTVRLAGEPGALEARARESGKTEALVRGIAAEIHKRGAAVGGFSANADSTVLPGSGLSSSATVEVLIGRIFDCLYADGKRSALEIAQIGQIAENTYFGKPCGLMDQTACASGGAVAIDFARPDSPQVRRVKINLAAVGYSLCVVNSGGNHADLTPDYAAIPAEMKTAAAFFGKRVLAELNRETILAAAGDLRKAAGDRAFLRALHFFDENERVEQMAAALEAMDTEIYEEEKQHALYRYLTLVNESGDSSWEMLQNMYPPRAPETQSLGAAITLSRIFFRQQKLQGACRVHGGGFAGTIQVYLPLDAIAAYRAYMEKFFGAGSVTELRIRPAGAVELVF